MMRQVGTKLWNTRSERLLVLLALLILLAVAATIALGATKRFASTPPSPPPTIASGPSSLTFSTNAHFTFNDPKQVSAFMCSLDGATSTYCGSGTSGSVAYSALAAGRHTFTMYATFGSRKSQPVQVDWRIEVVATGGGTHKSQTGGAGTGNHKSQTGVAGTSNHKSQAGGASTSNGVTTTTTTTTTTTATTPRVLDVVPPPMPVFTSTPSRQSTSQSATFAFRERKTSHFGHFECSLEGGAFYRCTSPQTFDQLKSGPHTFAVRAVGTAGNKSKSNTFSWTVAQPQAAKPFTITGNAVGPLYPGGKARPVDLSFTNPNSVGIEITKVTVTVKGTSTAACSAANFQIVQNLLTSPQKIVIPANSTKSLGDLSIPQSQWPKLQMLSQGNQNGCAGATVHLSYSGSAHS